LIQRAVCLVWLFFGATVANPLEIEAMVEHLEVELARESLFEWPQPIVFDFIDGSTLHTNEMVMMVMVAVIAQVVTRDAIAKIQFLDNM
jgi:hypothetical protein